MLRDRLDGRVALTLRDRLLFWGDGYQLRHIHRKPELAVSLHCTSKYAAILSTLPSKGSAIFRLRNRQQYSMVCEAYNTI